MRTLCALAMYLALVYARAMCLMQGVCGMIAHTNYWYWSVLCLTRLNAPPYLTYVRVHRTPKA